jgi:hypothetical protein
MVTGLGRGAAGLIRAVALSVPLPSKPTDAAGGDANTH